MWDWPRCTLFLGAYEIRLETVRTHIARGVVTGAERALAAHDDVQVLELITVAEGLGIDYEHIFLGLFGAAPGTGVGAEFRQSFGSQLVIDVQGFPLTLVKNGPSVDFSVRLTRRSTGRALSFVDVEIGANFTGCATVNGGRAFVTYTTNSDGRVSGLSVAAGNNCTEPFDQSLVFIRVPDNAAGLDASTFYLGRTIAAGSNHLESKKIAFVSTSDGNSEIYIMDLDGLNQLRLTNNSVPDTRPIWSPDGSKILFLKGPRSSFGGNIMVMNANGTSQVNLNQARKLSTRGGTSWTPGWHKNRL